MLSLIDLNGRHSRYQISFHWQTIQFQCQNIKKEKKKQKFSNRVSCSFSHIQFNSFCWDIIVRTLFNWFFIWFSNVSIEILIKCNSVLIITISYEYRFVLFYKKKCLVNTFKIEMNVWKAMFGFSFLFFFFFVCSVKWWDFQSQLTLG